MAYVEGFEHDIFVSYARVDDLSASEDAEGWVTAFEKHLRIALDQRVGRMGVFKIWRDLRRIDGAQLFDRTIAEALGASAVFVALTSSGYLASNYCRQELASFHRQASAGPTGLAVGDRLRIVNLLLNNVDRGDWPEEYGRTSGFPFHDAEREDERGQPSEPGSVLFKRQLRRLADALHDLLTSLEQASRPASEPVSRSDMSCTVFLADVPDTLRAKRRRVVEDLKRHRIDVLSDIPPPFDKAGHDHQVIETLRQADLSVHLLDAFAGREVDGNDGETYPRRQVELGMEHSRAQMIWIPDDLAFEKVEEEEAHRIFLQELERGKGGEHTYDFIRADRADVTRHVLEKVEALRQADEHQITPSSSSCLLVTHAKDTVHVLPVAEKLLAKGIDAFINQEANEPEVQVRLFEKRLSQVARLIVFYGGVSVDWVRERIDSAVKHAVSEGRRDLRLGVFAAPPRKAPEEMSFDRGFIRVHLLASADEALAFVGAP